MRPAVVLVAFAGVIALAACSSTSAETEVYAAFIDQIGFPPSATIQVGNTTLSPATFDPAGLALSLQRGGLSPDTAKALVDSFRLRNRLAARLPATLPSQRRFRLIAPRPAVDRLADHVVNNGSPAKYAGGFEAFAFSRVGFDDSHNHALVYTGDVNAGGYWHLARDGHRWTLTTRFPISGWL